MGRFYWHLFVVAHRIVPHTIHKYTHTLVHLLKEWNQYLFKLYKNSFGPCVLFRARFGFLFTFFKGNKTGKYGDRIAQSTH